LLTDWTRQDIWGLGTAAYQLGLTPENATHALLIGARLEAHGVSDAEYYDMIRFLYVQRTEIEEAVKSGTATTWQLRRYFGD